MRIILVLIILLQSFIVDAQHPPKFIKKGFTICDTALQARETYKRLSGVYELHYIMEAGCCGGNLHFVDFAIALYRDGSFFSGIKCDTIQHPDIKAWRLNTEQEWGRYTIVGDSIIIAQCVYLPPPANRLQNYRWGLNEQRYRIIEPGKLQLIGEQWLHDESAPFKNVGKWLYNNHKDYKGMEPMAIRNNKLVMPRLDNWIKNVSWPNCPHKK